jgi:hypothetical protein
MKNESPNALPDRTLVDLDTPAVRQQRIVALRRELDEAMGTLAEVAVVLTNAGVPGEVNGVALGLADRVRWLVLRERTP